LDSFISQLNMDRDILFVWLRTNEKVRLSRKEKRNRDLADTKDHFEFVDRRYPDIDSINVKNGTSVFIDTSAKTVQDVVSEIKTLI
ncbi:MAG TPA: hypothetical protein VGE59_02390, partial [Patescibacteria group bacterium]